MVGRDRRSVGLLVLAFLGATLLVVSMQTAAIANQPTYEYSVWEGPIDAETAEERLAERSVDVPREDIVVRLEELSDHTQSALETAFERPDEPVRVTGEAMTDPAFRYAGDGPDYGRGKYYVADGADYYLVVASAFGSDAAARIGGLLLTMLAVPLVLTTLYDADDLRLSVSVLGGLTATTLLSWSGITVDAVDSHVPAIGLGLVTLFGTATVLWGLYRIVPDEIGRSRTRQRSSGHVLLSLGVATAGSLAYLATTNSFVDGEGTATFFVGLALAFAIPGAIVWHGADRFTRGHEGNEPPA